VVLAVIGVFSAFAYPNISNWINDRNVKKEVYETISFNQRKKIRSYQWQVWNDSSSIERSIRSFLQMSPEKFFDVYKGFNSPYPTHKQNYTCGFSSTSGFTIESQYASHDFGVNASNSNVNVYPSAYHNPMRSAICITKDGSN